MTTQNNLINIDRERELVMDLFSEFLKEKNLFLHTNIKPDYGDLRIKENGLKGFKDLLVKYIKGMNTPHPTGEHDEKLFFAEQIQNLKSTLIQHYAVFVHEFKTRPLFCLWDDIVDNFIVEVEPNVHFMVRMLPVWKYTCRDERSPEKPVEKVVYVSFGEEDWNYMPRHGAELYTWQIDFKQAIKL